MRSVPISALSSADLASWTETLWTLGSTASPFLHPAWVRAVAACKPGVEVGVVERGGRAVGFVPFERTRFDMGGPVGSRLCDVSGVVAPPDMAWSAVELTRAARLRSLALPNVPTATRAFDPWFRERTDSGHLDLSGGFEGYRDERRASGSSLVAQLDRKRRKLEREVGPLRFEWHAADDRVFDALLAWKARQRRATRTPDILRLRWSRELVRRIRDLREDGFAGVLSALWAGDRLAAVHLGLRTPSILHYWIPTYNEELSDYSPGLIALMELASAAAERGVTRLDLGPGDERYKLRAASARIELADMVVSPGRAAQHVTSALYGLRAWARGSSLEGWLRGARRAARRAGYALRAALDRSPDHPPRG